MRTRRQAFGQHFLRDQKTIQKIVDLATTEAKRTSADAILEVGPGKWAITHGLTTVCKELRIPLILVERDFKLKPGIDEEIAKLGSDHKTEVHFMDAASENFLKLLTELSNRGLKRVLFVSNLPYSASSQILANLCEGIAQICGAVVMTQKELAERIVAEAGSRDRGSFSVLMQSYYKTDWSIDVPPGAFSPPPKVMSTVMTLHPLSEPPALRLKDPQGFQNYCKKLFSQRRKMVRNLVSDRAQAGFPNLGISGIERPEALTLDTLLALYRLECESDV